MNEPNRENQTVNYMYMNSPVGRLLLVGNGVGLKAIAYETGKHPIEPQQDWIEDERAFGDVVRQLEEYFAGERDTFDLELAPEGSDFQRTVWRELETIPYGQTISYGELAERVGRPAAARAVGAANGANPLSIVVPCHRVLGANGQMTGYGGGLPIKEALLALEGARLQL